MGLDAYRRALRRIPAGQTRTYTELAALAGRPGAARAAGRAASSTPVESDVPWHRVVAADGGLAHAPERAAVQLERLVAEGARARPDETMRSFLARVGARWAGRLGPRVALAADDERVDGWPVSAVEPLFDAATARARGFVFPDEAEPAPPAAGRRSAELPAPTLALEERLAALDPDTVGPALSVDGVFRADGLLAARECLALIEDYEDESAFERTIDMGPKGYGVGRYRYLREPAPEPVAALRRRLYEVLLPAARAWSPRLGPFPDDLDAFWDLCRASGQRRASSILLRYAQGGVNHSHRDVYGSVAFPFQALVILSRRGVDFEGGEFLLFEEDAGGAERERAFAAGAGDLIVFPTRDRPPAEGTRRRRPLRHGMRVVTRGVRYGLGVVLHLAE